VGLIARVGVCGLFLCVYYGVNSVACLILFVGNVCYVVFLRWVLRVTFGSVYLSVCFGLLFCCFDYDCLFVVVNCCVVV